MFKNNVPCVEPYEVAVGTTEVPVSLDGAGVEYFDFYVNGSYVDSFKVDFSVAGSQKVTLTFTVNE